MLLFLADNLAYFPYIVLEEPLFILHHIDMTISVTGSNLLQAFRDVKTTTTHTFPLSLSLSGFRQRWDSTQ